MRTAIQPVWAGHGRKFMGYNTTVLICNDALDAIENDPDFGKNLAAAIRRKGQSLDKKPIDVSVGSYSNFVSVIETHHSAGTALVAIGGNYGSKIAEVNNGGIHHTKESQWDLIEKVHQKIVREASRELTGL
jgi:hypothetical protein